MMLSPSDKLDLRVDRREMLAGTSRGRRDRGDMVTTGESAGDTETEARAGAEVGALTGDAIETTGGAVVIRRKDEMTATGSIDTVEIAIGVEAEIGETTGGVMEKAIGTTKGDTEIGAGSDIARGRESTADEALGQARAEMIRL